LLCKTCNGTGVIRPGPVIETRDEAPPVVYRPAEKRVEPDPQ